MNDPNGLVYHDGRYVALAQFSADGPEFKRISWGRWSSTDLLDWQFDGECIPPDAHGYAYSGSVISEPEGLQAFLTRHDEASGAPAQRQWSLTSTNGGQSWATGGAPLGPEGRDTRDPFVFRWPATGDWRMLVAEPCNWNAPPGSARSRISVWRSDDRESWTLAGHIGPWSPPNVMWEVPVLLDFGAQQVLVISMVDRRDNAACSVEYWTGYFDGCRFERAQADSVRLDEGSDFYAACFNSPGNWPNRSRVMVAWASSWETARTFVWPGGICGGPLTLPRSVELVDGRLFQRPVPQAMGRAHPREWQRGQSVDLDFSSAASRAVIQIDAAGTLHAKRQLADGSNWSRVVRDFSRTPGLILLFEDNGLIEIFSASGSSLTMFLPG